MRGIEKENMKNIVERVKIFLRNVGRWLYKDAVDFMLLLLLSIGLIVIFFPCDKDKFELINAFCLWLGIVGIIYCTWNLLGWFLLPIKRDWVLVHGNLLRKIICFVLSIPFAFTAILMWEENRDGRFISTEYPYIQIKNDSFKKELVFGSNMYVQSIDTFHIDRAKSTAEQDFLLNGVAQINGYKLSADSTCYIKMVDKVPDDSRTNEPPLFWSVYYHFIDTGNQHMTSSQEGRGWGALVAILGMLLLNGVLVSILTDWFDRRRERWQKGEIRYNRFFCRRSHYVIIGANDMVAGIVKQLFEKTPKAHILIQTSRNVEDFRRELFSSFEEKQQKRIVIYYGNITDKLDIANLKLEHAKEVFVLGEDSRADDKDSYHDELNMKCLQIIGEVYNPMRKNTLICRVMFEYQATFNILQTTDIYGERIKFCPFNYYEMWAQKVLICQALQEEEYNACDYLPLEGQRGIDADSDNFVHLVIVGMSRMGVAMAIEAAHLAHYPNFETRRKRTRITCIDANMSKEIDLFMGRFREMFAMARHRYIEVPKGERYHYDKSHIYSDIITSPWRNPLTDKESSLPYNGGYLGNDFIDIEWEFIHGAIEEPAVQQYLQDAAENPDAKLTVAVCFPENSRAIATAAYLPNAVYERALQVLVYQRKNDKLAKDIAENTRYKSDVIAKIKAFGMASQCYDDQLVRIAELISLTIDTAYRVWENKKIIKRCLGEKGLQLEDLGKLTPEQIPENKIEELSRCWTEWIKEHTEINDTWITDKEERAKEIAHELGLKKGIRTDSDKSKAAKLWSNYYSIYTMWTKFRCCNQSNGKPFNPLTDEFSPEQLDLLGKMEHNRWNVEQLLLRYRPLTLNEQNNAQAPGLYDLTSEKRKLKNKFAHLDICSNEQLDKIDYGISEIDRCLIKVLPQAYRELFSKRNDNHA